MKTDLGRFYGVMTQCMQARLCAYTSLMVILSARQSVSLSYSWTESKRPNIPDFAQHHSGFLTSTTMAKFRQQVNAMGCGEWYLSRCYRSVSVTSSKQRFACSRLYRQLPPKAFCFRAVRVSVCLWSYTKSLWTRYLTNCLREFHQIYQLELRCSWKQRWTMIRFWSQKVRAHDQTKYSQKALWEFWRSCVQTSWLQTTFPGKELPVDDSPSSRTI